MARMGSIQRGLVARLDDIPDFTAYGFVPDSVNVPCVIVRPGSPFVDYQVVMGGHTKATWHFKLVVLINRIDEESAQAEVDSYIDPDGPIVAAIHAEVDDELDDLADYCTVVRGDQYGDFRVGGASYFGAQLTVEVMA